MSSSEESSLSDQTPNVLLKRQPISPRIKKDVPKTKTNINTFFSQPSRPCSRVTGNRVKPNFTFVRNWENVVSPPAQVVDGKGKPLSGVLVSPRSIDLNSSISSIAETSAVPVIISHGAPAAAVQHTEEEEDEEQDNIPHQEEYEADNEPETDDNRRTDNPTENIQASEMEEGVSGSNGSDDKEVEGTLGTMAEPMEVQENEEVSSSSSQQSPKEASQLMPPPPNPLEETTPEGSDGLPDISPIPAAIPSGSMYHTPAHAGIKRRSNIMTSTPAPSREETPGLVMVESSKKLRKAAAPLPQPSPVYREPSPQSPSSTLSRSPEPPGASQADTEKTVVPEVQLWVGGGPLRRVSDATELDVLLTALEDVSYKYKQKDTSSMKKKTVNEFVLKVRKELTDVIDCVQEVKTAKSSLSKVTHPFKATYKELVQKQRQYFNLLDEEAKLEKEKKVSEKEEALKGISNWLFELDDLQKRYRATVNKDQEPDYCTRENLPALLKETIVNMKAAKQLKKTNDNTEALLKSRLNSSRHSSHLRDILE